MTNHGYDHDYESAVNRLIRLAEKNTKVRLRKYPRETEERKTLAGLPWYWSFWTEIFHEEMNRLTRESGLRDL